MRTHWFGLLGVLLLGGIAAATAADKQPKSPQQPAEKEKPAKEETKTDAAYDQSKVPLEVQPTDSKMTKIVLIAGHPSHGPGEHEFFAGCAC